jgi:hypothetical protein
MSPLPYRYTGLLEEGLDFFLTGAPLGRVVVTRPPVSQVQGTGHTIPVHPSYFPIIYGMLIRQDLRRL